MAGENVVAFADDGCALRGQVLGPEDGPPVLLVAGLGATRHGWRWQVPELFEPLDDADRLGFARDSLASDFRVAVFDNRGMGLSDAPEGPYSIAGMADDAVAFGQAALGETFHVVGVSMGGMVSLELVLRHRDAVRSLTLLCTSAGGIGLTSPRQEVLDAWANTHGLDQDALDRENARLGFADSTVEQWPELLDHCSAFDRAHPTDRARWLDQASAASGHDVADRLGDIAVPPLLIAGTEDRVLPIENSRYLAARIPGARLVEIEGAGHLVNAEVQKQVNDLIRGHIS